MSEPELLALWKAHGGNTHGPRVEHASMPLANLAGFCEALILEAANRRTPSPATPPFLMGYEAAKEAAVKAVGDCEHSLPDDGSEWDSGYLWACSAAAAAIRALSVPEVD